jgi:hypothetical protein
MQSINKRILLAPIIAVSTVFAPLASNAQFAPNNCYQSQNVDYIADIDSENSQSISCIQDNVDTIYNPDSDWRSNL